jgi:hypothetical protein
VGNIDSAGARVGDPGGGTVTVSTEDNEPGPKPGSWLLVAVAWLLVGIPLLWGIWTTLEKAVVLFR